jgi:hypothetical protein
VTTFTLDTNCIIALENAEPAAAAIRLLVNAHGRDGVDVAIGAISASERQRGGGMVQNFSEFQARLAALGMEGLRILAPMAYFDISFWDWAVWTNDEMQRMERSIHDILFPNVEFVWQDYCRARGMDPAPNLPTGRWRNCKCDVQAMWCHIHAARDVFVTSDENFHAPAKIAALSGLGVGRIEYPVGAAAILP